MKPIDVYQQAEGFYYAQVLCKRKTIGKVKRLRRGEDFYEDGPTHKLWGPQFAMLAFSVELYFKSIIFDETGSSPRGHNLVALFKKLTPEARAGIKREFDNPPAYNALLQEREKQQCMPTDFDDCLALSQNAFEEQRYSYENKGEGIMLDDIASSVRVYIWQSRPQWMVSLPPIDLEIT